jgi:hypothetical protein
MTSYCKKLKVEGEQERAKVFFAAYRAVYCTLNKDKRKREDDVDEPVDYSELWDLDEGDMVAL